MQEEGRSSHFLPPKHTGKIEFSAQRPPSSPPSNGHGGLQVDVFPLGDSTLVTIPRGRKRRPAPSPHPRSQSPGHLPPLLAMATAAFKSTSRRSAVGGADDPGSSGSAGAHRRSRSLSRCPGRFPPARPADGGDLPAPPRGRFVNTVRGSAFPEISLDDLADGFFAARDFGEELERESGGGRSGRRLSDASFLTETESSRRGRSVSRKGSGVETNQGARGGFDCGAMRRRSVSVARNRCSDSESESDLSCNSSTQNKLRTLQNGNCLLPTSQKPSNSTHALRQSHSQKDSRQLQDTHSRCSSTLTNDDTRDACNKSGSEKTICTVYDGKKTEHPDGDGEVCGLYEVMRKEVRHAVDEIRTELEKVIVKTKPAIQSDGTHFQPKGSEVVQAIAEIRRNYTSKLEESEKRRQELLAELAAEEQRGQELTKIVKELLPDTTQTQTVPERPSRFRRRSNDRTRMSKHLSKEAERYFEDFISSVEDTDISSFDGERSDGSSTIGGSTKSSAVVERQALLAESVSSPAEIDGLVLPWLKWETCNDGTPLSHKTKEASGTHGRIFSRGSHGSWSPGDNHGHSVISKNKAYSKVGEAGCDMNSDIKCRAGLSSFNMDEYMHLQHTEDFLFEVLQHRQRIESGGLLLCGRNFVNY